MKFTQIVLLLSAITCLLFVGCASSEKSSNDREKVSTVPWNRPAQWEGKGVLGGMVQ